MPKRTVNQRANAKNPNNRAFSYAHGNRGKQLNPTYVAKLARRGRSK